MAEAALVTFILEQLKEVAIGYKDLISGAAEEFKGLTDDLETLKAHLKEMAKRKKDEPARLLERRIRETVYEVEGVIDTRLTEAIKASHKLISFPNVSLAKSVKDLRTKLARLIQQANNLTQGSGGAAQDPHTESTRVPPPPRESRVVGFEKEVSTLTGYLLEETPMLDVISIVGVPGQGKTTLAWKVYNDISFHYTIRIWVNISEEFNPKDVLLKILEKFDSSRDIYKLDAIELGNSVRDCLKDGKFLLVLDDVHSVDTWTKIKGVLPLENVKGKVLITTREIDVGHTASIKKPFELEALSVDDSWKLLQYEVYQNLEDCPQELRGIGKNIAQKCDGVPLTIIVIGGVLLQQVMRSPPVCDSLIAEWNKVANNISEALIKDSQKIKDVVALSYDRLPDDLKDCFVYMGVFPEDYPIPAKMLCALWVSEGFVLLKDGKSYEESARENLTNLITRNLLKVEKTNHMGEPKTCSVHDMIRAFCIDKAKEQNFFTEIKISENSQPQVQNIHRLCLHSEPSELLSSKMEPTNVRSFLCFHKQPVDLAPKHAPVIPKYFPKLRILESKSIRFDNFPRKVVTLIHVRYLTLNIDNLPSISKDFYQLWNLQTLIVETRLRSIKMDANIWNMIRLRHLKSKAAIVLDSKHHGEAGQSLQTLDRLAPESCTDIILEKAKNLKTLGISGKLANVFASQFLKKLYRLEKLKLFSADRDVGRALSQGNSFPPNLKRLTLTNTWLGWEHISTLAMIKSLRALKLKTNSFEGMSWTKNVAGGSSFPNLELLLIADINLAVWEASAETFPSLRFLVVNNCQDLNDFPECLGLGTRLEKLELERVNKSLVKSAIKIEEARKGRQETSKFAVEFALVIDPASWPPGYRARTQHHVSS